MVRFCSHRRDAGRLHVHARRWAPDSNSGVDYKGDDLPLVGVTIVVAKRLLRDEWGVSFFADAVVNGAPVGVGYVLCANDRLEFFKRYGFKAGGDQPTEEAEAEGLLAAYPDLTRIAEEVHRLDLPTADSLKVMSLLVAQWVRERFGTPDARAEQVIGELVKRLDRIEDVLNRDRRAAFDSALNDTEQIIVEALGEKQLKAAAIATAARLSHNSHLKATLSSMVKRGVLAHGPDGYFVSKRSGPGQD